MVFTNLLVNMVVLTIHGAIPTNTPAIRSYAFETLFTNAQAVAHAWHLDESLISSNKVTELQIEPYPSGINGWIIFEQRYSIGTGRGSRVGFTDHLSDEHLIGYDTTPAAALEAWIHATNR